MKNILSYFTVAFLFLISKPALASTVDNISCVNMSTFSERVLEIDYNEGFVNCFILSGVPANSPLVILGNSPDSVSSRVRLYSKGTTKSHKYYDSYSSGSGSFVKETTTTAELPIIRINPTNQMSRNKRLSISFTKKDDVYIVVYEMTATDWVNWHGGNCGGYGCHYESTPGVEAISFGGYSLNSTGRSCSPDEQMPPGPANHDFNKHLRSLYRFGQDIEAVSLNFLASNYMKHAYLVHTFRTNGVNDLKNNDAYPGASPDYGNFWYGASLAALGYSEEYALYAGALYQEIDDVRDWSEVTSEDVWDALTNPQDNPDDPEFISKGHNYFNGAFQQDLDNDVSNSCTGDSKSTSSSASVSAGGGWTTTGGGVSFVGGYCLGNCGGHGTPTTQVTDLTEEEAKGTTSG